MHGRRITELRPLTFEWRPEQAALVAGLSLQAGELGDRGEDVDVLDDGGHPCAEGLRHRRVPHEERHAGRRLQQRPAGHQNTVSCTALSLLLLL